MIQIQMFSYDFLSVQYLTKFLHDSITYKRATRGLIFSSSITEKVHLTIFPGDNPIKNIYKEVMDRVTLI